MQSDQPSKADPAPVPVESTPTPIHDTTSETALPPWQVVRANIWGETLYFTIANPNDVIQRQHRKGRFYEVEELEIIRNHCPPGSVFCDIGANVGNHALFALKFLHAERVVLFEPNPDAVALLLSNLQLNGVLDRCDTSHLGMGLSNVESAGMRLVTHPRNLGAARMVETGDAGGLTVKTGDTLLAGLAPTFLKIDVEGMEMLVLAGLAGTIAAHRPTIFIEVDRENFAPFRTWVAENGYSIAATFRRYRTNENFLLVPA